MMPNGKGYEGHFEENSVKPEDKKEESTKNLKPFGQGKKVFPDGKEQHGQWVYDKWVPLHTSTNDPQADAL